MANGLDNQGIAFSHGHLARAFAQSQLRGYAAQTGTEHIGKADLAEILPALQEDQSQKHGAEKKGDKIQ